MKDAAPTEPPGDALEAAALEAVRLGRMEEAAELMARALAAGAGPHMGRNLCEVLRVLGRYDEALAAGLEAAARDPRDPLCHLNLSVLRYERREPEEAIASARRAIALAPDLTGGHFGLAEALLLKGELAEGWDEYEWRFRLAAAPPVLPDGLELPPWDGAPLGNGRLLLVADQGYGDSIQFARYIAWAADRCGELVLAASRELQPLMRQLPGVSRVFDTWEDAPACTAYAPLSGLPRLHGTRLDGIPAPIPYVQPDAATAARWRARLDGLCAPGHRRVGLVWAGRPAHVNDRNRSTSLKALAPLTALDGVTYVSLQKGPALAEVGGYFGRAPLVNLGPEIGDFGDTLAILSGLDLSVSVDTAVAHLAGAAGLPAFVMLPYAPDWRWLLGRSDSPWYPSLRLFRPPAPRDWRSLAAAVARALTAAA